MSSLDEPHDTPHVLPAVEADDRIDSAAVHVARQKAARVQPSSNDKVLPTHMKSCVLKVGIVLVRPEPRNLVVGNMLAKHVACCSGALLDSVLPVLKADVTTEGRLIMIRDISSGVHAPDVRLAIFINNNAIV